MIKDIEQVKQELLALYASELADAKAKRLTEQEVLLSEATALTQPLCTKSELLDTLVEQAQIQVMPIQRLDTFGTWLQSHFSTTDLQNYGIYLNQNPTESLNPGYPYLFINTGATRFQGALDQPVIATFVGAWTVDVRQATVHATREAIIHVKDDIAKVFWHGAQANDGTDYSNGHNHDIGNVEASTLTDQERKLRDALVYRLRQSGLEVIDNTEIGQRVLDEVNQPARMQAQNSESRSGFAERQDMSKDTVRQQIVYHGSGADFEAFDFSHMSEGEGAQAYGWGGYVTEIEGIGRTYAQVNNNCLRRSHLESAISRLEEALPFRRGDVKREGEEELKRLKEELAKLDGDWKSVLYSVEIPDDNGKNYLRWEKPVSQRLLNRINKYLEEKGMSTIDRIYPSRYDGMITNQDLYDALSAYPNTKKKASAILYEIGFVGISYPSKFRSGGTKEHSKNYVLFNEHDMKITDKVRFFRTPTGESYGFTTNGKIYIDPRIATAETPIHEYAHLWASVMRSENKAEWDHIVSLMKNTPIWDHVKRNYPNLKTDDEIADETLAHYSGRRGAERLCTELSKTGHAEAAIQQIKEVLSRFWNGIATLFKIRYTTAEEVADRVLFDLLRGVNPYKQVKKVQPAQDEANQHERAYNGLRHQFVGERGATNADHADDTNLRMDNLSVARQMEATGKTAKAIKLATGWERGVDNKWRYEICDFDMTPLQQILSEDDKQRNSLLEKYKSLTDQKHELERKVYPDAFFDEFTEGQIKQWEDEHSDAILQLNALCEEIDQLKWKIDDYDIYTHVDSIVGKDSELLKYYPELGSVMVHITDKLASDVAGNYDDYSGGIITLNRNTLSEQYVINHEVQHAIQQFEGFALGGSRTTIRGLLNRQMSEMKKLSELGKEMQTKQQEYSRLASNIGYVYERLMRNGEDWAVKKATDLYWEAMHTLEQDEHSKLHNAYPYGQSPSMIAKSGFHREQAIEELKRLSAFYASQVPETDMRHITAADELSDKMDGRSDYELYNAMAGEVEARNVQKRYGMSLSERRDSLASETEDVDRSKQIVMRDKWGRYLSDSSRTENNNATHRPRR